MKRILFISLLLLIIVGTLASALTIGDILLTTPAMAKITISALSLAELPYDEPDALVMAGLEATLFVLPNSFLLYSVYTQNPELTKIARTVLKFTDGIAATLLAGYGIYLVSGLADNPSGWDQMVGVITIAYSIPIAAFFGLDFIPYSFEKKKNN